MDILQSYQQPARNDSAAVGTSSVVLSELRNGQNPRKVLVVRNTSPNDADIIWISLGPVQATTGVGIKLNRGEVMTDSMDGDALNGKGYLPYQGTITAICETANGTVSIMER